MNKEWGRLRKFQDRDAKNHMNLRIVRSGTKAQDQEGFKKPGRILMSMWPSVAIGLGHCCLGHVGHGQTSLKEA